MSDRSVRFHPTISRPLWWGLSGLAGVIALLYVCCPFYLDPVQQPFTGAQWYNPYAETDGSSNQWRDANLHAHARAWAGLTNGTATPEAVQARYRSLGYDIVGISDYERDPSRQPAGVFPVYEHGLNAAKAHLLVIGAPSAQFLDFPLWQGRHQRQFILDRLHAHAPLVAIAHPGLRDPADRITLPRLSGYDLLEVFNHFIAPADSVWDAILSAGHPVWLLASDDSHNLWDRQQIGVNRTRILSRDTSAASVIAALRAGQAVGIHGVGADQLRLESLRMRGDTMTVRLSGPVSAVRVIGAHGRVLATRRAVRRPVSARREGSFVTVRLVAPASAPYLRVVAEGPKGGLLYTNPVVRWNGQTLPHQDAMIDRPRTTAWRASWSLAGLSMILILATRRQRRMRTLSA